VTIAVMVVSEHGDTRWGVKNVSEPWEIFSIMPGILKSRNLLILQNCRSRQKPQKQGIGHQDAKGITNGMRQFQDSSCSAKLS
jgi:hypothetical protein